MANRAALIINFEDDDPPSQPVNRPVTFTGRVERQRTGSSGAVVPDPRAAEIEELRKQVLSTRSHSVQVLPVQVVSLSILGSVKMYLLRLHLLLIVRNKWF